MDKMGSSRLSGLFARLADRLRWVLALVQVSSVSAARWVDAFWGYDVFIAHRRADAAEYANAIFNKLTAERITAFIDREVYGPGDSLLIATRRHVAKSALFLLLGSPELLSVRKPVDWVEREIDTYLSSHAADPKLILVDFGGTIETAMASQDAYAPGANPILGQLAPFLRIQEEMLALSQTPSEQVLDAVRRNLKGRRRDRNRLRFFETAAAILVLLLLAAVTLGLVAWQQKNLALEEAARARASLIWNRLESRTNFLQPAQIDALWELASEQSPQRAWWQLVYGRPSIQTAFLRQLAEDRTLVLRFARLPDPVLRAFGLHLPDEKARSMLGLLLGALRDTTEPDELRSLALAIRALPIQLTEEHEQTARCLILDRFKNIPPVLVEDQARMLRSLAIAAQALHLKLTAEQARVALTPILHLIDKTTVINPRMFRPLIEAVQALPTRPTDEQGEAILRPVLDTLADRVWATDEDVSRTLAWTVKVLAPKLSSSKAQETVARVFEILEASADLVSLRVLWETVPVLLSNLELNQQHPLLQQFLRFFSDTADPLALSSMAPVLQALLTDEQRETALTHLLQVLRSPHGFDELNLIAQEIRALPLRLTRDQTREALEPLLSSAKDVNAMSGLAQTVEGLASQLQLEQAQTMLGPVVNDGVDTLENSTSLDEFGALAQLLRALRLQLTDERAQTALQRASDTIGTTLAITPQGCGPPCPLGKVAWMVETYGSKLSTAQVRATLAPLLSAFEVTTDPNTLQALAQMIAALPLTGEQENALLIHVLDVMSRHPDDWSVVGILAQTIHILPVRLNDQQARAALRYVMDALKRYSELTTLNLTATEPLRLLSQAMRALAPKLPTEVRGDNLEILRAGLGSAANAKFALAWATALNAFLPPMQPAAYIDVIVDELKYPTAAIRDGDALDGTSVSATDLLLHELHMHFPDTKELQAENMQETLTWIVNTYPSIDLIRPPVRPRP